MSLVLSDSYHWRRILQSHHVRSSGSSLEARKESSPSVLDAIVEEAPSGHLSPKKRLKPGLSRSLLPYTTSTAVKDTRSVTSPCQPIVAQELFSFVGPDHVPSALFAEAETTMEIFMQAIMSNIFWHIGPQQSSPLLVVFEAYRHIRDENLRLRNDLAAVKHRHVADSYEAEQAKQSWGRERDMYKAEIKRLEVIVSKGPKGLAGMVESRQNSILDKRDGRKTKRERFKENVEEMETGYEFLARMAKEEGSKSEPQPARKYMLQYFSLCADLYSAQPRARPLSPSQSMKELSQHVSMTSELDDISSVDVRSSILSQTFALSPPIQDKSFVPIYESMTLKGEPELEDCAASSQYSSFESHLDTHRDDAEDLTVRGLPNEQKMGPSLDGADYLDKRNDGNGPKCPSESDSSGPDNSLPPWMSMQSNAGAQETARTTDGRGLSSKPNPRRHFSFDFGDDSTFGSPEQAISSALTAQYSLPGSVSALSNDKVTAGEDAATPSRSRDVSSASSPALNHHLSSSSSKIPSPVSRSPLAQPRRDGSLLRVPTA